MTDGGAMTGAAAGAGPEETKAVLEALWRIPGFEATREGEFTLERQGGLTNKVYKLGLGGQNYILRIPGKGTEDYIDRAVELHNARIAAEAGVSAEVVHGDEASGVMLTSFIDGIVTMSPALFKERSGAPARAAQALKQMHGCGQAFRFRFELFAMIDDYLGILDRQKAQLPEERSPRSQIGSFMPEYSQSTTHMRWPSSRKFSQSGTAIRRMTSGPTRSAVSSAARS